MSAESEEHPSSRLDSLVHHKTRLGVLSILHVMKRADFAYIRDGLGLSDGNLGSHLSKLAEAGLIDAERVDGFRRARTWYSLTAVGEAAYAQELDVLREIITPGR